MPFHRYLVSFYHLRNNRLLDDILIIRLRGGFAWLQYEKILFVPIACYETFQQIKLPFDFVEIPAEELGGVHGYLAVRRPVEKRHADVANVAIIVQATGFRQKIFDRLVVVSFLFEHLRHPLPTVLARHVRVFNPTGRKPITSGDRLEIRCIQLLAAQEERDAVVGLRDDQAMMLRRNARRRVGAKAVSEQNRVAIIRDAASFAS